MVRIPTMMPHLMIDLETLGTAPDSVILSMGAVFFNRTGFLNQGYEWTFDMGQQLKGGRKIDASTLTWWMSQEPEARKVLFDSASKGLPVRESIEGFLKVCEGFGGDLRVWSCGASFDVVLMENLLASMKLPCPWKFWNIRCYRTMKSMFDIEKTATRHGPKHVALADATFQAECLMAYLKANPDKDR